MNSTQPIRKISRFVVSKVAGPPAHNNATVNQQQVADAARTFLQQAEELKALERQNVPSHYTDDLHGKRCNSNNKNKLKTNSICANMFICIEIHEIYLSLYYCRCTCPSTS